MATTTFNPSFSISASAENRKESVIQKFFAWCAAQNEHRLLWLGIALAAHGCILTPLTLTAVVFAGTNMVLFMATIVAMLMALVTNLAALPTKITLPVFFLSILTDLVIVGVTISSGFSMNNVF